jgi:spore coat protein H
MSHFMSNPGATVKRIISIGWLCCVAVGSGFIALGAAGSDSRKGEKMAARDDLFSGTNVLRIQIEIPREGTAAMRNSGWGRGQQRTTVKATVKEGGRVYTNVAIHLKGAAGSFRPIDDNPGLTLNFDKFVHGQSFHGLDKFSLNNSVQDPSFLSEKICRELFEVAGVPVPRAAFAKVQLNGRDLGLRVLTEGFNKQFLKRHFRDTRGNLYDGGFVQDITGSLTLNSGDNPRDHSGLRALISATGEGDPAARMARLEQVLDMDRFLSYVAMDVMQCDWDGYPMNRNNWRVFHDLETNKMVFFPHGLDQMFGVERTTPDCPILPHMQGMVAAAVLGTVEGRRRYLQRMSQLYTNVFHREAILKRVDQLAAVIRPVIAESNPSAARRHDQEVQWLKTRIAQRDESLKRQLGALTIQPKIGPNGTIQLTGWRPRTQSGTPNFRDPQGGETASLLYIGASNGNTTGSWRTRLLLDPGLYRFEGKVRTRDVKPASGETNAGAGLRISGGAVSQELSGSTDWRHFTYSFQVSDTGSEVEFVCELRAPRGEAWFDAATLQAVRLR